jgi:hypothetical protein
VTYFVQESQIVRSDINACYIVEIQLYGIEAIALFPASQYSSTSGIVPIMPSDRVTTNVVGQGRPVNLSSNRPSVVGMISMSYRL